MSYVPITFTLRRNQYKCYYNYPPIREKVELGEVPKVKQKHCFRHTGDKYFKCDLCEVSFYTHGDARRHRRVHTREKIFGCPTCAQRFTYSTSLNKHMLTVHGIQYKWGDNKYKEARKKTSVN